MTWLGWCAALGPASLILCSLLPAANRHPRRIASTAFATASAGLFLAIVLNVWVWLSGPQATSPIGAYGLGVALYIDALSAAVFMLVTFIGAVVLRYSRNYLDGDPRQGTFIQRLGLTIAMVQLLALSGNFVLLVLAWVGASLALNRLLLFYPDRRAAVLAARKKFVVSRLGDGCLIAAGACLYAHAGTLDYPSLFAAAPASPGDGAGLLTLAALLLAVAALLKSAQFPLHGWILEVMETPTPVSALLHAGIINAGGFLVIRFAAIFQGAEAALYLLAIVGGATAIFASLVMLTQTSIKVSLAYSTIAQMGFMLLQCGLGAFPAAFLHIIAHSLYKAHAFLSSGSVIDVVRASWQPRPGRLHGPSHMTAAIVGACLAAAGIASALGAGWTDKPGVFTLAVVFAMSLSLLLANGMDDASGARVLGRILLAAGGVAFLYIALHAGVERLLAAGLPPMGARDGVLDLAISAIVIVSFGAVTWLQSRLGTIAQTPLGHSLYVHLNNGLYVNTLANRFALRLWPSQRQAREIT
jgi:NAD(P)H-quinone oxidoreductase subunit 5